AASAACRSRYRAASGRSDRTESCGSRREWRNPSLSFPRTCRARLKFRQVLLGVAPARQALAGGAVDQTLGVADRERMGVLEGLELAPGDRTRHRGAGAGAGGIGQDGRAAALVAQVVEEDAPLALGLAHVG